MALFPASSNKLKMELITSTETNTVVSADLSKYTFLVLAIEIAGGSSRYATNVMYPTDTTTTTIYANYPTLGGSVLSVSYDNNTKKLTYSQGGAGYRAALYGVY